MSTGKLKSKIEKYWNWRSCSYDLDINKSVETANSWRTTIHSLVNHGCKQKALDVGTGPGQLAFYLAEEGFEVTGVDISPSMISIAGEMAKSLGLKIDFCTGDAEKLEFEDNSFDVVVSRNLIWTLPDPTSALQEWHRVLKPGGRIIISDGFWQNQTWQRFHTLIPNMIKSPFRTKSRISLRFFLQYAGLIKKLPLYEGVTKNELKSIMQLAGFHPIQSWDICQYFNNNPYNSSKRQTPAFFVVYADK